MFFCEYYHELPLRPTTGVPTPGPSYPPPAPPKRGEGSCSLVLRQKNNSIFAETEGQDIGDFVASENRVFALRHYLTYSGLKNRLFRFRLILAANQKPHPQ